MTATVFVHNHVLYSQVFLQQTGIIGAKLKDVVAKLEREQTLLSHQQKARAKDQFRSRFNVLYARNKGTYTITNTYTLFLLCILSA